MLHKWPFSDDLLTIACGPGASALVSQKKDGTEYTPQAGRGFQLFAVSAFQCVWFLQLGPSKQVCSLPCRFWQLHTAFQPTSSDFLVSGERSRKLPRGGGKSTPNQQAVS
eukprot:SAG31_NODE_4201_length_3479_cov_1.626331_3_plen_110_part_00